jgi:uncharacterized repeat protein (TIGR04138 family)
MSEPHPILQLLRDDPRYKIDAYQFVREALTYAQEVLALGAEQPTDLTQDELEDETQPRVEAHLTGQQLCEAIRMYALEQYGLMAKTVLNSWGLYKTSDFGNIVYNLIEIGLMKKSKEDRREDFDDVYDFDEGFKTNFKIKRPTKQ